MDDACEWRTAESAGGPYRRALRARTRSPAGSRLHRSLRGAGSSAGGVVVKNSESCLPARAPVEKSLGKGPLRRMSTPDPQERLD